MEKMFKKEDRLPALEVMFDAMISGEMRIFHKTINEIRKKGVSEEYIERLEKSYEEYVRTASEVFRRYGEKFSIKLVREKIPQNLWTKMQKAILDDPEIRAHNMKILSRPWNDAQKKDFQKMVERKKKQADIM